MKHKIYYDVEDIVEQDFNGEPELVDELEHYSFIGDTVIQCLYSRRQQGVDVSDILSPKEYHKIGETISFSDIPKNYMYLFIKRVFNE